jgi:hypothetical protein
MYDHNKVATMDEIPSGEKILTDYAQNGNSYQKVSLRYADGRSLVGYVEVFSPNTPSFKLFQFSDNSIVKETSIHLDDLKIIAFVQDATETDLNENQDIFLNKATPHSKVEIVFKDAEMLTGRIIDYRPNSFGFFLIPDQGTNPVRVFVVSTAMRQLRAL